MHYASVLKASVAILALGAAPAVAQMKYDNDTGGSVLLYGQINPALQSVDDGGTTTTNLVDSAHSNTRVGLKASQPFSAGDFGFLFETALGAPGSDTFDQNTTPDWTWDRTKLRHIDLSLQSSWGKVSAGQGSMATDGVAQSDLSGTTLVTYVALGDTAGNFKFRNSDGTLSGVSIKSAFSDLDGGRLGRVRYDSPDFNGFGVAVAGGKNILSEASGASKDSFYDIGLRYGQKYGTMQVAASIGYAQKNADAGGNTKDTMGSVSLLHQSGFNVTVAAGQRQDGGKYSYGKLGYTANWFQLGGTSLGLDFYNGKDFNSTLTDDKMKAVGFGVVQKFTDYNVEGYFGYRNYDLSATGENYQKMNSYLMGARWKF